MVTTFIRRRIISALALCGLMIAASASSSAQDSERVTVILDRYVEAIGGKANLERIQTRVTQATMSFAGGIGAKLETIQQYPDRFNTRSKVTAFGGIPIPGLGDFSSGYDGTTGWEVAPKEGFRRIEESRLQQHLLPSRLDRAARLEELYPTRRLLPDAMLDGKKQHVLEMSTTFGTQEIWSFDAASGLLTRTEVEGRDAKQVPVKVTSTFDDYREVDGVRLPFRTNVQAGKDKYTIVVTSVAHNVAVEAKQFAPPKYR